MDLALILVSIVSFFGLVLTWTVLPASKSVETTVPTTAAAPVAH